MAKFSVCAEKTFKYFFQSTSKLLKIPSIF